MLYELYLVNTQFFSLVHSVLTLCFSYLESVSFICYYSLTLRENNFYMFYNVFSLLALTTD